MFFLWPFIELMIEVKMVLVKTYQNFTILTNLSYTTTTRFGGAYYNRCAGSYLSSYCSPVTSLHLFYLTEQLPATMPKMLGKILSWIIYLIFNYRPRLVGLELLQNICKGREYHGNTFRKQNIGRSFKVKDWFELLRNQLLKITKTED